MKPVTSKYSYSLLATIREKVAIHDVIGTEVFLQRYGKVYYGRCPFHAFSYDLSLRVDPENARFSCHKCGKRGDHFQFMERYHGISYDEAVERVIAIGGELPNEGGDDDAR